METPKLDSPAWQTLLAFLGFCGVTLGAAYRIVRMPLQRLRAVESRITANEANIAENERRDLGRDKEIDMNRTSIESLHAEHARLREMILAQPTKDDLYRSEQRTMDRVVLSETNLNNNINRVVEMLGGNSRRNGH